MKITLSLRAVTNSVYALAALDGAIASSDITAINTNLLCPDRLKALATLVGNECSALAVSLFPFVTDCVVPPCDDCDAEQADSLMELEIPAADRLMPGMAGALRRAVEQLLGLRCLLAVYSMAGIRVERRDVEARSMLASIRGQLDSPLGGHPSVESWLI